MRKIHKMVKHIKEELEGACMYAEKYVIYKNTKPEWSRLFAEMANDELEHATVLHKIGDELAGTFSYIPEDDKECWEHCGAKLAEMTAEIRLLLSK